MAVTHTFTFGAAGGATTFSGIQTTSSGTLAYEVDVSIPASTTDQVLDIAIDVSELESVFLYTDGALTVETNASNASGGQTLTFAANSPLVWVSGMPTTNPLTPDVTKFYMTNAGSSAVRLRGIFNQSE